MLEAERKASPFCTGRTIVVSGQMSDLCSVSQLRDEWRIGLCRFVARPYGCATIKSFGSKSAT
jgi:hypothetical protein